MYIRKDSIPNANYHRLLAWLLRTVSALLVTENPSSSPSPSQDVSSSLLARGGPLHRRSLSPNAMTSLVAGILVSAFVIFAGVFLYFYGRSIRIHAKARRHHRHRHPRRESKGSQGSDGATPGGGDGAPADAGEQA